VDGFKKTRALKKVPNENWEKSLELKILSLSLYLHLNLRMRWDIYGGKLFIVRMMARLRNRTKKWNVCINTQLKK